VNSPPIPLILYSDTINYSVSTQGYVIGTSQTSPGNEVVVFPNPAKGEISVLVDKPLSNNTYFELYDFVGKLVMRQKVFGHTSQKYMLNNLSGGTYRIVIWDGYKKIHEQSLIITQ
jgi:hypothetical protein